MKLKCLLGYFLLFNFAACNYSKKPSNFAGTLTQATDTTNAKPSDYKIDTSKQNTLLVKTDTLLTVDLNNNKGSVRAYLNGVGKYVIIIVPVKSSDSIKAEIIPENDTANIRFNQIYIPVGNAGKYDGPFSKNISYPITVKGNYKLIVGEDLMAEGDWKGNFICNILIK
ncbi:MAG: hypothetical protein ACR2FN_08450 [Chitinophagaceae bacterium]